MKTAFRTVNEHGVRVFSQRPTNMFCGYFAELVNCNVHPKNKFGFLEFFNGNISKFSCWLVGILGVHVHCVTTYMQTEATEQTNIVKVRFGILVFLQSNDGFVTFQVGR